MMMFWKVYLVVLIMFWKVYLAQDVKHGFVALKTVDSQRMGVVSLYLKSSLSLSSPSLSS